MANKYSTQHPTYLYLTPYLNVSIISAKTRRSCYNHCHPILKFLPTLIHSIRSKDRRSEYGLGYAFRAQLFVKRNSWEVRIKVNIYFDD